MAPRAMKGQRNYSAYVKDKDRRTVSDSRNIFGNLQSISTRTTRIRESSQIALNNYATSLFRFVLQGALRQLTAKG